MNKLKELSVKGWIATVLMFSSAIMTYLTYGKSDLCDFFAYMSFFGLIGLAFASCEGDNPFIQIGDSKKEI